MDAIPLLSARSFGDGTPVLFIHGWECDGDYEALDFEPVFTSIPGFRRIYVDLPGMGATRAGNVHDLDDMLSRLCHFVDKTIAGSRFSIVGSSLGAYLAGSLAFQYREQVDGLLLRVPLVQPENSKRDLDPWQPLYTNAEVMESISPENRPYMSDVLVQTPEYVSKYQSKVVRVRSAITASDSSFLDMIRSDNQRYHLTMDAAVGKLYAPTLIISGRQDEVTGYRDSLRLLDRYPRATFAVLDRETHALPVDDHRLFHALVHNWLFRVREWQSNRG